MIMNLCSNRLLLLLSAVIIANLLTTSCASTYFAHNRNNVTETKQLALKEWRTGYELLNIDTCIRDYPMSPIDVLPADGTYSLSNGNEAIKEVKFHHYGTITGIVWVNLRNDATYKVIHYKSPQSIANKIIVPFDEKSIKPIIAAIFKVVGGPNWETESCYYKIGFNIPGFAKEGDLICENRWVSADVTIGIGWISEDNSKIMFLYLPKKVYQELGWATENHTDEPSASEPSASPIRIDQAHPGKSQMTE